MKKTINIQAFIIGCFITLFFSSAFGAESTKDTPITTNLNQPNVETLSTPDPGQKGCSPIIKKYTKSQLFFYGETGDYGIEIKNKGGRVCYGVKFVDTLPQGMSFSPETVPNDWDCSVSGKPIQGVVTKPIQDAVPIQEVVTCQYKSPLSPNTIAHLHFNVNIPSLEDAGGVGWEKMSVTNCATASGSGFFESPMPPLIRERTSCLTTRVQENKRPFKLKVKMPIWQPDGSGDGGGSYISYFNIPTNPSKYAYDYNVDCDSDGVYEAMGVNGDYTCEYSPGGAFTTYIVSISGEFPHLFHRFTDYDASHYNEIDRGILSVEQWGDIEWRSMRNAFLGALDMTVNALDVPDLTRVTDISYMFANTKYFNHPLEAWDVSNITNMKGMFRAARSFNQPLEGWDVSNVTDISWMFANATSFNQPVEGWDVSNVEDMGSMFAGASAFNQPLEGWSVSRVTDMSRMFFRASAFNQPLESWDVSNVEDMEGMFFDASAFNQPLEAWDVSNVTGMTRMFYQAESFANNDLSVWDVSNVEYYDYFLTGAGSGNIEPIWN